MYNLIHNIAANKAPTEVPAKPFMFSIIPNFSSSDIAPVYAKPFTPPSSKTRYFHIV